ERRPREGLLVLDPGPDVAPEDRELALIVRMAPDPPGEQMHYACTFLTDRHKHPGAPYSDALVEGRRWIAIRSDREVLRATATRAEAIRNVTQWRRQWQDPPLEPEPEAEPEGDDLVELGILADAAARKA
ncbi:hypothetical protein CS379_07570, partial [Methylobacterium frigidaeris]